MKFKASFTVQLGEATHTTEATAELPSDATPEQIDATIKALIVEAVRTHEEKHA